MSAASPALSNLGSKISIITKVQIRYEGILFAFDTDGSSLTLANVRSFGTEDRATDRPVAPRDYMYHYIIFRGSEIQFVLHT